MFVDLRKHINAVNNAKLGKLYGKVTQVVGLVIRAVGISAPVGEVCMIYTNSNKVPAVKAEVVGFKEDEVMLMPFGDIQGIKSGDRVMPLNQPLSIEVGEHLLGRTISALGDPIDEIYGSEFDSPSVSSVRYPIRNSPPPPFERRRISEPLATGIRAIDGLLTCGKGQRMGIFAGSGVGKSILLGMIARNTSADVNVIALVGERGREVRDFIEKDLGTKGLLRSVVVVATSDQPPLLRAIAPFTAMAIAEYFRDRGRDVLLMMDSITRYAMAEREIGLSIGEPPTTKGYTPSVFAKLPKLLERAGTTLNKGTITGLFTVLVEADDMNDPIGDAVRSILDGHIVLSRELAVRNHYPAIEVTHSISRLMIDITGAEHQKAAARLRETLAVFNDSKDLIDIGAYTFGSSPKIDYAIQHIDKITSYLRQSVEEKTSFEESVSRLIQLLPQPGN